MTPGCTELESGTNATRKAASLGNARPTSKTGHTAAAPTRPDSQSFCVPPTRPKSATTAQSKSAEKILPTDRLMRLMIACTSAIAHHLLAPTKGNADVRRKPCAICRALSPVLGWRLRPWSDGQNEANSGWTLGWLSRAGAGSTHLQHVEATAPGRCDRVGAAARFGRGAHEPAVARICSMCAVHVVPCEGLWQSGPDVPEAGQGAPSGDAEGHVALGGDLASPTAVSSRRSRHPAHGDHVGHRPLCVDATATNAGRTGRPRTVPGRRHRRRCRAAQLRLDSRITLDQ